MDKVGVVEVVDRPQSRQVPSTSWVSKQRLDGSYKVRLVARGLKQTVSSDTELHAGTPKVMTLRAFLTIAAIHGNPVAFGDCHSAFHQSTMPSESEPMYVEQHRKHSWTLPILALQESFSRTQDISTSLEYSQHTENQRHELQSFDIRSFETVRSSCVTWMTWWARDQTNIS